MLRRHFQALKPHGEEPEDPPVAEDECLPDPPQEMSQNEDVPKDVFDVLEVVGVLQDVDATVHSVVAIDQRNTEVRVKELHKLTSIVRREGEDEQKETLIDNRNSKNNLPDHGMRPCEWPFLELE